MLFRYKTIISKLLLVTALTLLVGCNGSKNGEGALQLSVNYSLKNLLSFERSDYEIEYEIISLELPKRANFKIFLNVIELFEDQLYISTKKGDLIIFDSEGNYLNRIEKGEKIDQLSNLMDFSINREKRLIEVLDGTLLKKYTLEGRWLESTALENLYAVEIGSLAGRNLFLRQKNSTSDYSFKIEPEGLDFELKRGQTMVNSVNPKHFHHYNGSLYFTGYSNGIYRLSPEDSLPKLFAKVGEVFYDPAIKGIDRERYETLAEQKRLFSYINNFYLYNDNLLGFTLSKGAERFKVLYDSERGKSYIHPLNNLPYSQNNRWVEQGAEYFLFPSYKYDEEMAQKVADISPELNALMEGASNSSKMWVIKANFKKR